MSDHLVTVGRYGNPAEAEIAHSALTEEDIPAFVEGELAAISFPGASPVKLQVPEDRAKSAFRVLEKMDRERKRRLPQESHLPGDRLALQALLISCVGLILFPVLMLFQAFAVALFGQKLSDLLRMQTSGPILALPLLFSLASTLILLGMAWWRPLVTEEGEHSVHDAWRFNLIVLAVAGPLFVLLLIL